MERAHDTTRATGLPAALSPTEGSVPASPSPPVVGGGFSVSERRDHRLCRGGGASVSSGGGGGDDDGGDGYIDDGANGDD